MDDRIARLIELMNDESSNTVEDAESALRSIGVEALGPLAAATPLLHDFGQLSAIELFEHFGDPGAGPVLIELLDSDNETVRAWSASALAGLDFRDAVPALRAAYDRLRARREQLDTSEAIALRDALTVLGGRREVLPPLTASCRLIDGFGRVWPTNRLAEVIDELAGHRQLVLSFTLWTASGRSAEQVAHERLDRQYDSGAEWSTMVAVAAEAAQLELACAPLRGGMVATLDWVDESDR